VPEKLETSREESIPGMIQKASHGVEGQVAGSQLAETHDLPSVNVYDSHTVAAAVGDGMVEVLATMTRERAIADREPAALHASQTSSGPSRFHPETFERFYSQDIATQSLHSVDSQKVVCRI
jgi:hypothetical protein